VNAVGGGGRDVMVYVDRHKMSQVIHNLVSNAIKFTPSGGHVTVTATVDTQYPMRVQDSAGVRLDAGAEREMMDYVKVTVTDTGAGLTQVRPDE